MGSLFSSAHKAHEHEPPWGAAAFPRQDGEPCKRKVTDGGCCRIFIAFVVGMVLFVLSGYPITAIPFILPDGWEGSNPSRLTHGVDYKGEICGVTTADPLTKYMMFCGSPERSGEFPKYIIEGSTVCVAACPTTATGTIDCLMPAVHNFTSFRGGEIGATPNVETLEMTLTQSVTTQQTYPTEEWGGRFCLPSAKNPELRSLLIDGPWGQNYRPLLAVGGLMDAWPLFLISAVIAWVLGYAYLYMLQKCAGMIILGSMIFTTLLSLAAGFFFFFAIVLDTDDATSTYSEFNPIMSVYIGSQAKAYSVVTGVVIILIGMIFAALTATSVAHIDECIGLIDASMDCCYRGATNFALTTFATVQSIAFLLLVFFAVMWGLPRVAALGVLGPAEISVNGKMIPGLQNVWTKTPWQNLAFWYYLFGMLFLLEVFIQVGHYIVSYTVASWYFSRGTESKVNNKGVLEKALAQKGPGFGKVVEVRVGGVDANYGSRMGTVVTPETGQKMLVVPVGRKGPGLGRNDMELFTWKKDAAPSFWSPTSGVVGGFFSVLTHHIGSIALGALIIWPLRPFRILSQCVQNFLSRTADPSKGPAHSDDAHTANIKGCLSLFSACLEQAFGKFSKTAYTELVLSGGGEYAEGESPDGFLETSENAFKFLVKSGGSIAHLHGAMLLYEMSGIMFITLTSTWVVMILQDKLAMFNEKDSITNWPGTDTPLDACLFTNWPVTGTPCGGNGSFYIEDKIASTIVAMVCAFAVSFSWMSMWNHTSDTLLYCVAWNRRQCFYAHENGKHDGIGPVAKYCPQSLRSLIPEHELDVHHEHGLHAHGLGQQGAILAAMEHGAMSATQVHGGTQVPDYGKSIAGAHAMATRIVG